MSELKPLTDETGWLIELFGQGAPTYYGKTDEGTLGMTGDHNVAIRFARKVDADATIDDIGWTRPQAQAVEHMWCDGRLHSLAARSALRSSTPAPQPASEAGELEKEWRADPPGGEVYEALARKVALGDRMAAELSRLRAEAEKAKAAHEETAAQLHNYMRMFADAGRQLAEARALVPSEHAITNGARSIANTMTVRNFRARAVACWKAMLSTDVEAEPRNGTGERQSVEIASDLLRAVCAEKDGALDKVRRIYGLTEAPTAKGG